MLAPVKGQRPAPKPAAHAGPDVASCILALIDGLSDTRSYMVAARNGELFITPVHPFIAGNQAE